MVIPTNTRALRIGLLTTALLATLIVPTATASLNVAGSSTLHAEAEARVEIHLPITVNVSGTAPHAQENATEQPHHEPPQRVHENRTWDARAHVEAQVIDAYRILTVLLSHLELRAHTEAHVAAHAEGESA